MHTRQRSVSRGRLAERCILEILEERCLLNGIWISTDELMQLPTSGPAWDTVLAEANTTTGLPVISDQHDQTDTNTLAKALVGVRLGDQNYTAQARANVMAAIGTEQNGTVLALCRNLAPYVVAADLIGLDPDQDTQFRTWLRQALTEVMSDGRSLQSTQEDRPNNFGTMAGGSRAAVAAYLGDQNELARTAQIFQGWLGDRSSYDGFQYGELSWQADPTNPVGINPLGATKDGHSIDGALPEEMRRGGPFQWPPVETGYPWEALQGAVVEAEILSRAGYNAWEWQDQALLRAVQFLDTQGAAWEAMGDDEWTLWIIDAHYGTNFASNPQATPGKIMGWTAWTHQFPSVPPTLSVSIGDATVTEGNSTAVNAEFIVARTGDATNDLYVDYFVLGSGADPADADDFGGTLPSGTLFFAAGETSKPFTISVSGDITVENDEGFTVTLLNPSSTGEINTIIGTATATGTIQNDDARLSIAPLDAVKAEPSSGTSPFTFTVSRTGAAAGTATATYTVSGIGTSPANSFDFGGSLPTGTVSFSSGQTTQTITVNVSSDTLVESDETFKVTLSNPSAGTSLATAIVTGKILGTTSTFTIAAASAAKAEGNTGTTPTTPFTFTVTRTGSAGMGSVNFAVTGSGTNAANAADFSGGAFPTNRLSFASGESSKTLTIDVIGDAAVENNETFTVTLSSPVGGSLGTSTATGTINNDDATLSIAASSASKDEGNGGSTAFTFTVTRSGNTTGTGSVDYAVAGSGVYLADTADFGGTLPGGTLSFAANETTKTLAISVTGDTTVENDEGFNVALSSPSSGIMIVTASATGTIVNDDGLPNVLVTVHTGLLTLLDSGTLARDIRIIHDSQTNELVITATTSVLSLNGATPVSTLRVFATGITGVSADLSGGNDKLDLATLTLPATVLGGDGNDTVLGGSANDSLQGDGGADSLNGGSGNDSLSGGIGKDVVIGGAGTDTYFERTDAANVTITNTTIVGVGATPTSSETIGTDMEAIRVIGGDSNNVFDASTATKSVRLEGAGGEDVLTSGSGADVLLGGSGNDLLNGKNGNDTILGGVGDDTVLGGAGNDVLDGEAGNDTLKGQDGNDALRGGMGNDALEGLAGNDTLLGGADNDLLMGGDAADTLIGEAGADTLYGATSTTTDLYTDKLAGGGNGLATDPGDQFPSATAAEIVAAFTFNFDTLLAGLI